MDAELHKLVGIAARGYLAEMDGRFCECAEPDIVGRAASLCFRCGLVNRKRKQAVNAEMQQPHPYEAADPELHPGMAKYEWCAFCSYPKNDQRHRDAP